MPIEILMPALSPTMTEGNLAKWLKQEGDAVAAGDVIAEIETDKATMEVEAVDEGVIGKIVVPDGTEGVAVNALIAVLKEEDDSDDAVAELVASHAEKAKAVASEAPAEEKEEATNHQAVASAGAASAPVSSAVSAPVPVATTTVSAPPVPSDVKASPVARRIAANNNIDLSTVKGSGPKGRVVKSDVEDAIKYGSGHGSAVRRHPDEAYAVPNDTIRKVIARRLTEAKQTVPHFYLNITCSLDKLLECRKDINSEAPISEDGKPLYKLSVNDFVIKAVALALAKVPAANASWSDDAIIRYNNVDVSVAVATDNGLITPIIRNADQKSLLIISDEMKALAAKARANKLTPEEFQGGGFSISNLGMYGIKNFNAIVNPPQACILAVGAGEERVVVEAGEMAVSHVVETTLSCDHRVVDGAVGAEFLAAFRHYVENPVAMLI